MRLGRSNFRPRWSTGGMEGRMDGRLEIPPCVLQDIGPFGAAAQKGSKTLVPTFRLVLTDGPTDQRTDGPTDGPTKRVVGSKKSGKKQNA